MESLLGVRVVGSSRMVELPSDTVLWEKAIFIALIAVMVSAGLYICYNIYTCRMDSASSIPVTAFHVSVESS